VPRIVTGAILLSTAGLHALAWATLPLVPKNDSVWYLGMSHAMAGDRIFDPYAVGAPVAFDIHYTVGYPLFLDLVRTLFGWEHLATGVLAFHHAAVIVSVWLVLRLGVELGRPAAGAAAAIAYALYFPALYYAQLMISEALFTFLALAAALAFVRAYRAPTTRGLLVCGGVVGLATVVRPIGAVEAAVFAGLLALEGGLGPFAPRARRIALLAVGPALCLGLSLVHNQATYGRATLSDASGRHLIDRVWAFDRVVATDSPDTARIFELCRRSGEAFQIPGLWWDSYKALRTGSDLTPREADDLLRGAAWESIAADPVGYLTHSGVALWQLFSEEDTWPPPLEQTLMPEAFTRYLDVWTRMPADPSAVSRSLRSVEARREFRSLIPLTSPEASPQQRWWVVQWRDLSPSYGAGLALATLIAALALLRVGRRGDWIPALVVLGLALPPALVEYPYGRYRQPLIPFMLLIVASAGWEAVVRWRASVPDEGDGSIP